MWVWDGRGRRGGRNAGNGHVSDLSCVLVGKTREAWNGAYTCVTLIIGYVTVVTHLESDIREGYVTSLTTA